ncbi:MAG: hypothetical protein J7578_03255 [Chitinophagaceae bacterium]|nr:hypothetical protein [Chitinophagaceae bacterium]
MKPLILSIGCLLIVFLGSSSCRTTHNATVVKSKPLPPGQAKKLTGSQSAKPYAPGQRKKKRY